MHLQFLVSRSGPLSKTVCADRGPILAQVTVHAYFGIILKGIRLAGPFRSKTFGYP